MAFHRFIFFKCLPWQKSSVCISRCLFVYESRIFIFSLLIRVATQRSRRGLGHAFRNYFHIIATNNNKADNREFVWPLNLETEQVFQCGLCSIEQPLKDTCQQNAFLGKQGQIPKAVQCQTAIKRGGFSRGSQRMCNPNEQQEYIFTACHTQSKECKFLPLN